MMKAESCTLEVWVVLPERVLLLDIAGPMEVLRRANVEQDAIIANPTENWTLTRLAKIANTSSRHLSRLFNEHAGMNITTYINSLRVALAHQQPLGYGTRRGTHRLCFIAAAAPSVAPIL